MKHVTFHLPSFLRRVRIHGGEFDSSARAMNRVNEKGSLMTYEGAFLAQADPRIVRGSTIERKQMSTKTTFKRVALVAVAALGLGVMSVAPSNAAAQLDSLAVSLASTTQSTTETLTATSSVLTATLAGTKGVDTLTVTASIVSGPAYVQPILAFKESTTAEIGGSGSIATVNPRDTSTVTQATGKFNVYLNAPSVVGTYVVKLTPTGGTNAVAVNVTIVVSKMVYAAVSATHSRVWTMVPAASGDDANVTRCDGYGTPLGICAGGYSNIYNGRSTDASKDAFNVSTATTSVKPNGIPVASFAIIPRNESGSATTLSPSPITVAITSGPGTVAIQGAILRAKSVTESVANSGADGYDPGKTTASAWLIGDGTAGVTTVTFSMDGVLLRTVTISQIGTTSAYVFGTPSKTVTGVGETSTVTITGADSLGTTTGTATGVYAFSSDTAVATVAAASGVVTITGVKSGTATITVGNAATLATSTITKTLAIKVGAITAKTVAFSMSPSTPQPGEKVTLTVTATDASGNAVGDGSRNLFTSAGITTGLAVQGATWTAAAAVTLVGGTATYTFYAPTGTGTLEVSATEGASTDSTTKAAITGSVTITNSAVDAATDAANEAYDAANAATDAALAAAEAADAATVAAQEASDAVAALSESVTKLIAGLQAQIKSLAAVLARIAKKVKA